MKVTNKLTKKNLSEKIEDLEDHSLDRCDEGKGKTFYWSEDVREAVMRLKDEMLKSDRWKDNGFIITQIDEIFGQKLT